MAKPNKTSRPASQNFTPAVAPTGSLPEFFLNFRLQGLLIFGFAFALYANTLGHEFVVDDAIVITDNMFTSKGVAGIGGILTEDTFFGFFQERGKETLVSGGRYRPLTLVLFAMLWQVTHSPFAFHLLTVLLFAATCVVVYRTLLLMLENQGVTFASMVAWIAALLFAAHPVHTEVVANVKGCDEIVTLLLSLGGLYFALLSVKKNRPILAWTGAAIFFFGLLSKENSITFLAIIPLALWFFTDSNFGKVVARTAPFFAAAAFFMVIRTSILGFKFGAEPMELMNNPFLKIVDKHWVKFAPDERLATILFTLGKYLQLLFAPLTLTHDYYPRHIDIMKMGNSGVLFSIAAYTGLIWLAVRGFMKKSVVAFGILFFLLTLSIVSNLLFPVGTNMGERFVFMPSLGFCLAIAALVFYWMKEKSGQVNFTFPLIGVAAVLLFFSIKTLSRNNVWQSNERLFLTDIAVSKNSAKLCNAVGGTLTDKAFKLPDGPPKTAMLNEAAVHLINAIKIHPTYKNAYLLLGNCYNYLKQYDNSVLYYREALKIDPVYKEAKGNLAITLREGGRVAGEIERNTAKAIAMLQESYDLKPDDIETIRLNGVANGLAGNHTKAIFFFEKLLASDPKNARYMLDLGTAYLLGGDPAKGQAMRQEAMRLDPSLAPTK